MTRYLCYLVLFVFFTSIHAKTWISSRTDNEVQFRPLDWAQVEDEMKLNNTSFYDGRAPSSRRLVTWGNPDIIPFGSKQVAQGNIGNAYRFLFRNMRKNQGKFVLYPYAFSVENEAVNATFDQGAIMPVNFTAPTRTDNEAGHFLHYKDTQNFELARAKALYDSSIAILKMEDKTVPVSTSSSSSYSPGNFLTIESYSYCYPLCDYIGEKYMQCWESDLYRRYQAKQPGFEPSSVVYLNETDIQRGFLFHDSGITRRFGVFVLPSIYDGTESSIAALLGPTGKTQILSFVESGGLVFASGKGNLLLQELGLANPETFDPDHLLLAENLQGHVKGCEPDRFLSAAGSSYSEADFIHRTLCFGVPADASGRQSDSISSAPMVLSTAGFTVTSHWDPATSALIRKQRATGLTTAIDDADAVLPHTMYKQMGKGFVVSHLGNPMKRSSHFPWFYNALFLTWAKPLILDMSLSGNNTFIPGLEQSAFAARVKLVNLYDEPLVNATYHVWVTRGFDVLSPYPAGCAHVNLTALNATMAARYPPPPDFQAKLHADYMFDCTPNADAKTLEGRVDAFDVIFHQFRVFVTHVKVTQKGEGIPVIHPVVKYILPSRDNLPITVNYGPLLVDAYMAALLRSDINADPMGSYPVAGQGTPLDNVIWAENKEETMAEDVVLVNILPLFSPVFDGNNQAQLVSLLDFDHRYYQKEVNGIKDFKYPFDTVGNEDTRDFDFLDWRNLGVRGNTMVADWDTPVKIIEYMRNETPFEWDPFNKTRFYRPEDISNSNYQTNVDNDYLLLKQVYFADSDNFYEHATQRLLSFVDSTTAEGFKTYNHSSRWVDGMVPGHELYTDPATNSTRKKTELVLVRTDIYFYMIQNKARYPLPKGMRDDQVEYYFSLDRYSEVEPCDPSSTFQSGIRGSADRLGYFSSEKVDGYYPPGHKPTQFRSKLYQDCKRRQSNPETDFDGDDIQLTHYLVRLDENGITSGNQVMDFVPRDDYWVYNPDDALDVSDRHYGRYDEIRIQSVMASDFDVSPESSRRGGRIIIRLPNGVNLGTNAVTDVVHFAADQIAVLGTTYDPASNSLYTYFKRGNMPNEAYGEDSALQVNIDRLTFTNEALKKGFTARVLVYSLIYDLSQTGYAKYSTNLFESYSTSPTASFTVKFSPIMALRLPAVRLEFPLRRGPGKNESFIAGYEYLKPYTRYGLYVQDVKRRDVWGSAEVHLNNFHGAVSPSSGFAWISNVGISSIPFREFLTSGVKQMIPAGLETSRIEWKDIWGRQFSQPIRSIFFDVPPIPPPLRNFMMTTTFEVMNPTTGERMLEWISDEEAQVHVEMKFYNNYPKHFEITTCNENTVVQVGSGKSRIFDPDLDDLNNCTNTNDFNQFLNLGNTAWYGSCLQDLPVTLSNTPVTKEMTQLVQLARSCSANEDWYDGCEFLNGTLPTISRAPGSVVVKNWNYIRQVEDFYPNNYIKDNMWSLQHYDYDDNAFDKAYKYHMDNLLPNVDTILGGLIRPHNIVAFPVYKGLGYEMEYDSSLGVPGHEPYHGWWSDNLQNRDHTVLAGQSQSNDVAVGADSLVDEVGWLPYYEMEGLSSVHTTRIEGNLYSCLFNRHRLRTDPKAPIKYYMKNVVMNNVVPVNNTLSKNDARLTNFACEQDLWYSPTNISDYNNMLYTETPRDWLYFALNLRGNAKENIHVTYTLKPLAMKMEGMVKVQDGARFVYWNPALGPNAFLIVDSSVNVVNAKRTDVTLYQEIFPSSTTTFNGLVFTLLRLEDVEEKMRVYDDYIHTNHNGFGDAAATMYVGSEGTSSIINPGQYAIARVELINNAGFDWNLFATAMNSSEVGESTAINAHQLMSGVTTTLQQVDTYNFLKLDIPDVLRGYVEVVPSDHVLGIAPMTFDFEDINVGTIRDGFQGTFFFKIRLFKNATENPDIFGKVHHIGVNLVKEYFDKLPGYNDPTNAGYHDYTITIPDIVFAVPFTADHPLYPDKAFYTSGYASDVALQLSLPTAFSVEGAKYVTELDVEHLRDIAANEIGRIAAMEDYWEKLPHSAAYSTETATYTFDGLFSTAEYAATQVNFDITRVPSTITPHTNTLNINSIPRPYCTDRTGDCNQFPFPIDSGPDKAEVYILLRSSAAQLAYGSNYATYSAKVTYRTEEGKMKADIIDTPFTVGARGAWLEVEYSGELQTLKGDTFYDQKLRSTDVGRVETHVSILNRGNDDAFNVEMSVVVPLDITLLVDELEDDYTLTNETQSDGGLAQVLVLHTNEAVPGGETLTKKIYLEFMPCQSDKPGEGHGYGWGWGHYSCKYKNGHGKSRDVRDFSCSDDAGSSSADAEEAAYGTRQFLLGCVGKIDLTETKGERRVSQRIESPFDVSLTEFNRPTVNITTYPHRVPGALKLSLEVGALNLPEGLPVQYRVFRRNIRGTGFYAGNSSTQALYGGQWVLESISEDPVFFTKIADDNGNNDLEVQFYADVIVNQTELVLGESEPVTYSHGPEWWIWLLTALGISSCGCVAGSVLYLRHRGKNVRLPFSKKWVGRRVPNEPDFVMTEDLPEIAPTGCRRTLPQPPVVEDLTLFNPTRKTDFDGITMTSDGFVTMEGDVSSKHRPLPLPPAESQPLTFDPDLGEQYDPDLLIHNSESAPMSDNVM